MFGKTKCLVVTLTLLSCCYALLLPKEPKKTGHEFEVIGFFFIYLLMRNVSILPSLHIKSLLLLDSDFRYNQNQLYHRKRLPRGSFLMPTHPFLICTCPSVPFLSLLGCSQASARKVMEQDKMVCASVGQQRSEDAASLYSLNYRNLNALLRACSSAADLSYRSLIPSVQPV